MKILNFDSGLKELELVVSKLENGNLNLNENLKLYEKGVSICKQCKQLLKEAKLKVEILNNEIEKG